MRKTLLAILGTFTLIVALGIYAAATNTSATHAASCVSQNFTTCGR